MDRELQRILYIEDEADIRRVAKIALEALGGLTVIACASGEEAIAMAVEANPDLILLDVMMPHLDGPSTLRRLRELPSIAHVPVVFVTAKVQPEEIEFLKSLGALDVIGKPFDAVTLAEALRAIWQRAYSTEQGSVSSVQDTRSETPTSTDASAEAKFVARLVQLQRQFESELPLRLQELRRDWSLLTVQWNLKSLEALHINAHNLAGSGATFGYEGVTQIARNFDLHLKAMLSRQGAPDDTLWRELTVLFLELETELRRIVAAVPAA